MRFRLVPVVLAVAGVTVLVLAPVADAVGAPAAGWWSRLATATPTDEVPAALPVPAPSAPVTAPVGATVPDGQLLVEGTVEGAVAVAAARWELADGESSASLTLPIGPGSTVNPQSVVLACKAAAPWTVPEGPGGSWDTKPLVDGSRCVNGVLADDLSTVSFGVQPLVSGSLLDVVLVPGREAPVERPPGVPEPPVDADGSVFRWLFDTPTAASVEVVAGSDFAEGEGDRVVTAEPPELAGLGPVEPAPPTGPDLAPGSPSPPFEAPAEAAAPALEPQDLAPSVPDLDRSVRAAVGSSPANRTVGFILLALAALAAAWSYWSSPRAEPAAIGLGRFRTTLPPGADGVPGAAGQAAVLGGLSRFARPRRSPPTPLS